MKIVKYLGIAILVIGALGAAAFFIKSNAKSPITYETETAFKTDIEEKSVATGKVIPKEEVLIKPQISGIIDEILVEEGDQIKAGDLIARIKVVPNEQALMSARGRVSNAEIALRNAKIEYERNKTLFDRGVVASQDFLTIELRYNQALQELQNAKVDYQIIKSGSAGGEATANTNIRATISGTILEIPVEEGFQVIQANNFNDGTTIATIADMSRMIFEGQVDEAEVGKLELGMPLEISLGALQEETLLADLKFVAPKGVEEQGAVQFKIEGDINLDSINSFIRAGYSANASMILERKEQVLAIKEALLQYDKKTDDPYVEVQTGDQEFERRDVELGISDGINVEILSGIDENDKIKVWNKTEPVKRNTDKDDA
ncbi:efflux RND transporter periplasmic adaptor subunit [Robertkochia marina]|uniref:Efflux RND transporter periplasmic adaptor subunit n=1 Tax=Robertkochia marina TaxID=1227945 RepID=A0A4S3M476_9FLAO|nr:efflux RND transporter periplasmic adaptor subunit [Robertkochia marina]THD69585.1 efflux RND transporter periplasmic adaptor subunit [Robertkochia marina]TRZ47160.1 efflux RND transporter periplasmic adaptor subunit [Robertkochia marina]